MDCASMVRIGGLDGYGWVWVGMGGAIDLWCDAAHEKLSHGQVCERKEARMEVVLPF